MDNVLLKTNNLCVEYATKAGFGQKHQIVHALNGVNLEVCKGEIYAVAGESGCGKSTLANSIMRLIDIKSGSILFNNREISDYSPKEFYTKVQMIFQNPYSSLNPKMKIKEILEEPLLINTDLSKKDISIRINDIIFKTGLNPECLNLYPHEFSGGQRQRISIARSLVLTPEFIIADEPVSALDVSIQAQIINLLLDLKNDYNLTFLFISHDLNVIKYLSDKICIMYLGEIVEYGLKDEIFNSPKHPYTMLLLSAIPSLSKDKKDLINDNGELPSPRHLPNGCKFHTRCPFAKDICKSLNPEYTDFTSTHKCKCFLYE